jgi:hypothetical protein
VRKRQETEREHRMGQDKVCETSQKRLLLPYQPVMYSLRAFLVGFIQITSEPLEKMQRTGCFFLMASFPRGREKKHFELRAGSRK